MKPAGMSGLEILRAFIDGRLPQPSMTHTIPTRAIAAERGSVRFGARADERHLNTLGGVHGGFAATVLDSATGSAVHSMLDAGVGYSTVDLSVNLVKAIPVDQELTAEAKVIHLSTRLGVAEGFLRDAVGTLLAHATATCLIQRPSGQPAE